MPGKVVYITFFELYELKHTAKTRTFLLKYVYQSSKYEVF